MSDSVIICKFLSHEYPDDSVIIYIYCCTNARSIKIATDHVFNLCKEIFYPAMSEELINNTIKIYLDTKKNQHERGEIKIKSIY